MTELMRFPDQTSLEDGFLTETCLMIMRIVSAGDRAALEEVVDLYGPIILTVRPTEFRKYYFRYADQALRAGHWDLFEYICDQAPSLLQETYQRFESSTTIAHCAAEHESVAPLKYINRVAPELLKSKNSCGNYPSTSAAICGHLDNLDFLANVAPETIAVGGEFVKDSDGSTVIHELMLSRANLRAIEWIYDHYGCKAFIAKARWESQPVIIALRLEEPDRASTLKKFYSDEIQFILEKCPRCWAEFDKFLKDSYMWYPTLTDNLLKILARPDVTELRQNIMRRYRLRKELRNLLPAAAPFIRRISQRVLKRPIEIKKTIMR